MVLRKKIFGGTEDSLNNYLPNHWNIILELDNDKYACVQLDTSGKIDLRVRDSLRSASLFSWGWCSLVRLSCKGSCKYIYIIFLDNLKGGNSYIILINICQNFPRKMVEKQIDDTAFFFC